MRITIIQPALPVYRQGLFSRLADRLGSNFVVYASRQARLGVLEIAADQPTWQRDLGPMRSILPGLDWQQKALSVPIHRGDVVVVCGEPRTLSTIALMLKGWWKGARTIWWGHYWSASSRPWRAALRFALMRFPDAILFYTDQEVAEYVAQLGGWVGKPVHALNNGVETREIVTLRTNYRPAERPRDLLFIGRITEKAEVGLLLDALARSKCGTVTLDVIGDGPDRADLEQKATALGIAGRVSWHGAVVDEARIACIANRCKAFVYPGSVGLSLVHGLAYGLPAIVHGDRWKHMPEIAALKVSNNGVTFERGNVASLDKVVTSLLADMDTLSVLSNGALKTIDSTFNVEDMVERFCEVIANISGDGQNVA